MPRSSRADYEPGLEAEVASAAYSAHLLQDEETVVSQGNVCVKGAWTNILERKSSRAVCLRVRTGLRARSSGLDLSAQAGESFRAI